MGGGGAGHSVPLSSECFFMPHISSYSFIADLLNEQYFADIQLGTPPQSFKVKRPQHVTSHDTYLPLSGHLRHSVGPSVKQIARSVADVFRPSQLI
jgi:hypothetical protein